jgi:methylmalonyl-CoA/ethylmalonyl-CoA epimerase
MLDNALVTLPKECSDPQTRFHHVGFVVASIEQSAPDFVRSLGLAWRGEIIHDPLQCVRVSFFDPPADSSPVLELVEPADPLSPVTKFLERGGGLHHLCYEVDSLDMQLKQSRANGGLIARKPTPAVAFGGRRIAWVYTKSKLLLEYLER